MDIPQWVKESKAGDKVVCVNDEFGFGLKEGFVYLNSGLQGLKRGGVYTISSIQENVAADCGLIFVLKEITRPALEGVGIQVPGFNCLRFKPLVNRKHDISVFTDMLKTKEKESA